MHRLSKLTIYTFGTTSLLAGVMSLANPTLSLQSLDLPFSAVPAVRGNALAAIAMGIYYGLAAWQDNQAFFAATIPMRLLTTSVFWAQGWTVPAIWEGVGSLATGLALVWERRKVAHHVRKE